MASIRLTCLLSNGYLQSFNSISWRIGTHMSTTEILRELPNLSQAERRAILNRLIELDEDAEVLEEHRYQADEAFLMLDAMEADDAETEAR